MIIFLIILNIVLTVLYIISRHRAYYRIYQPDMYDAIDFFFKTYLSLVPGVIFIIISFYLLLGMVFLLALFTNNLS